MSDRKCSTCRRPVSGHIGPNGQLCSLTPLKETLEDGDESFEDSEVSVTDKKLDALSEKFDRLMNVVEDLSVRVKSSEKRAAGATGGTEGHPGKSVQQGSKTDLSLPPPTWKPPGDGGKDGRLTTQSLSRDVNNQGGDDIIRAETIYCELRTR